MGKFETVPVPFSRSTPEGRWSGFGPYYAMFPIGFAQRVISQFSQPGDLVLDPFCGRGTAPYVAQAMGRNAIGIDLNPVGWIFAKVKTDPYHDVDALLARVQSVLDGVARTDKIPETDFQSAAWSPSVLSFLQSARRNLNWRRVKLDRTLMALILVHLHAKLGEGLSNQMRQSKAMAPDYAVRWWKARDMNPPQIDIMNFFTKKLAWRYSKGIPKTNTRARIYFGDARSVQVGSQNKKARLILTSPPYCGVTNYEYDNWIRLWMLGGPNHPNGSAKARFGNRDNYNKLIHGVLEKSKKLSADDVRIYVRTGASSFDTDTTLQAIEKLWPTHRVALHYDCPTGPTQTSLYGHDWTQEGEMDILAVPKGRHLPKGFELV